MYIFPLGTSFLYTTTVIANRLAQYVASAAPVAVAIFGLSHIFIRFATDQLSNGTSMGKLH